jgi:hypothetical protein
LPDAGGTPQGRGARRLRLSADDDVWRPAKSAHDALRRQASNLPLNCAFDRRRSEVLSMIRKLASGQFRLYSRKTDPKTGKRRNLGTFNARAAAEKHERQVQYFKRH